MKTVKVKKSNVEMGLEVKSFPKHKQWALDQDYAQDLDEATAAWLGRFNQEFYRNRFESNNENNLHNTTELKRKCYSAENARNRDLYAVKNTGGLVDNFIIEDEDGNEISSLEDICDTNAMYEDDLIDMIDKKRAQEAKNKKKEGVK